MYLYHVYKKFIFFNQFYVIILLFTNLYTLFIISAVINNVRNGNQVEFDDKMNCFSACMFKKIGIVSQ
jgi:hypothetical protein